MIAQTLHFSHSGSTSPTRFLIALGRLFELAGFGQNVPCPTLAQRLHSPQVLSVIRRFRKLRRNTGVSCLLTLHNELGDVDDMLAEDAVRALDTIDDFCDHVDRLQPYAEPDRADPLAKALARHMKLRPEEILVFLTRLPREPDMVFWKDPRIRGAFKGI